MGVDLGQYFPWYVGAEALAKLIKHLRLELLTVKHRRSKPLTGGQNSVEQAAHRFVLALLLANPFSFGVVIVRLRVSGSFPCRIYKWLCNRVHIVCREGL
jgi:hypothetical protein